MTDLTNMLPIEHFYVSTACHHDNHGECRKTCKFCHGPCRCGCHKEPTVLSELADFNDLNEANQSP